MLRKLSILVAVLLVAIIGTQGIAMAVSPSVVSIEPSHHDVGIGDTFEVDVYITPQEPIAGGQVELAFDPVVLQADAVVEGDFLANSGEPIYFSPGTVDNLAGTVEDVFGVIAAKAVAVSAPGVFATVTFTAMGAGTSAIEITDALLGALPGQPATLITTSGDVMVYPDWDINMDGEHNVIDMVSIVDHFAETGAVHWVREDVNRDGEVNVLDMILVGQHWTG